MRHAPGPWTPIKMTNDGWLWEVNQVEGARIRDAIAQVGGESAPQAQANARLIAAVPDLLSAAIHALDELKARDDDSLAFIRLGLDMAIAKATGGVE